MAYQLQNRLRHASRRMAENNVEPAVYTGTRNGESFSYPLSVSPILISAEELSPGNVSVTLVEYQDFVVQRVALQNLYPPEAGDEIRYTRNQEKFRLTSMGMNEPPYQHVTSKRERLILHTARLDEGFADLEE